MTESGRRLRSIARRLGGHQTSRVLLAAAGRGAGVGLLLLAALLLADRWFYLAPFARAVLFAAAIAAPFVLGAHALFRRLPALRSLLEAARATEAESEELRERLVPALQVLEVRDDPRTGYSPELVDALVDQTLERAEAVRPATLAYNLDVRRGLRVGLAGAVIAAIALTVIGPAGWGRAFGRLAGSYGELGPKPDAVFAVTPGNVSIPRGEAVNLGARIDHARARDGRAEAALQWRPSAETPWVEIALDAPLDVIPGGSGSIPTARFEHRFPGVRESFEYRFRHADAASAIHTVLAVPRPTLTIEEVRYRFPEYTGLPERTVRDGAGDLAAVRGTRARLVVRCTNEPESGSLALASGDTLDLEPLENRLLAVEVPILADDSYRLSVVDTLGLANPNPLEYRIRALGDEAPFIRLIEPGEDIDLDETMRVDLRFSAVDDYGLGPVELVWEVSRREGEVERRLLHAPEGRVAEISESATWDLSELEILPGDTIVYHLETTDNDAIGGPKAARTREYAIRFPTLGEIFARIDEETGSGIEELEEFVEDAKRVEEQIEDLSREVLKRGESTWENRQEVEQALEAQAQLAEELERIRTQIEDTMQRLAESEFSTLEAMQKMERISDLLDEVMTREMREALEKLREALQESNPRRMEEDLAEFREDQDELMKQLDRVIRNLEQFRLEEKMKAAVRQADELAARQERVNEELAKLDDEAKPDAGDEAVNEDSQSEADEADAKDDAAVKDDADANADELAEKSEEMGPNDPSDEGSESSDKESESESKKSSPADESKDSPEESPGGSDPPEKSAEERAEQSDPTDRQERMKRLAREEEMLAEEARRLEKELEEIAKMTEQLRESSDAEAMRELSEQANESDIPETMEGMSESMEGGSPQKAEEQGEEALTKLESLRLALGQQQQGMAMKFAQVNQAAINRAVRDLLGISADEEALTDDLTMIPRNGTSATRAFADEQFLLIQGGKRVEEMLTEVAKDTPLMESSVGRRLENGLEAMSNAARGLEDGAVHIAWGDTEKAVEEINAVVIDLLQTAKSMSSCSSGMPTSDLLQKLQEMSGDQQSLHDALKKLMEERGSSMDHRLQAQLEAMGEEQRRIQEQLEQLLKEIGDGPGTLGRLDDVSEKLAEIAEKLARGEVDEEMLREQDWASTRLLDAQRSMRERDYGKQRKSETGDPGGPNPPPAALPDALGELDRDLREDLLKALERRYPPKYEELIKRYFRSLSDDVPAPDLP